MKHYGNKWVLSMDLNDCKDDAFCIDIGRLFHRRGAATEKALSPTHFLNFGTKKRGTKSLNFQFIVNFLKKWEGISPEIIHSAPCTPLHQYNERIGLNTCSAKEKSKRSNLQLRRRWQSAEMVSWMVDGNVLFLVKFSSLLWNIYIILGSCNLSMHWNTWYKIQIQFVQPYLLSTHCNKFYKI